MDKRLLSFKDAECAQVRAYISQLTHDAGLAAAADASRWKAPVTVAVTGAAGAIGYQLLFKIASGAMLGPDQPVVLHLLDLPDASDKVRRRARSRGATTPGTAAAAHGPRGAAARGDAAAAGSCQLRGARQAGRRCPRALPRAPCASRRSLCPRPSPAPPTRPVTRVGGRAAPVALRGCGGAL